MSELILLRGLPGSGKSTLSKEVTNSPGSGHFESDQYFVDDKGKYNFNPLKLKEAHKWCKDQVEYAMTKGHKSFFPIYGPKPLHRIVVSNTFTQEWEMKPYYELAEKYDYIVYSLVVENRHNGINSHGVPDETLDKMENRFEIKLR